jgi:hypothetical protein
LAASSSSSPVGFFTSTRRRSGFKALIAPTKSSALSIVARRPATPRLTPEDGTDKGDQYVFLAIAGAAKAILSYRVGKRNQEHTSAFVADLRARVLGAPEISSDGLNCYPGAIEDAFGIDVTLRSVHLGFELNLFAALDKVTPAILLRLCSMTRCNDLSTKKTRPFFIDKL